MTIWPSRPLGTYPQTYVEAKDGGMVDVSFYPVEGESGIGILLTRHHARMLARRINQCLDRTTVKGELRGGKK